jgi:hypothetical protein
MVDRFGEGLQDEQFLDLALPDARHVATMGDIGQNQTPGFRPRTAERMDCARPALSVHQYDIPVVSRQDAIGRERIGIAKFFLLV